MTEQLELPEEITDVVLQLARDVEARKQAAQ